MRKYYLFVSIFIILLLFIIYQFNHRVATTMQYFPIDESATMSEADTLIENQVDNNKITWKVHSTSDGATYLRQDVSLLYANGKFKGILNQWEQNTDTITMEESFRLEHETLLQSISFHHGEIHDQDDKITSIQKMTYAELLVPSKSKHQNEESITKLVEQQLYSHWQELLQHYDYSQSDYELIPLVDFITYDDTTLPNRSETATKRIVGQFWEGLYKNYFISLSSYRDKIPSHWMPVILIANDQSHLIVLYEIDGEKYQLIQKTN